MIILKLHEIYTRLKIFPDKHYDANGNIYWKGYITPDENLRLIIRTNFYNLYIDGELFEITLEYYKFKIENKRDHNIEEKTALNIVSFKTFSQLLNEHTIVEVSGLYLDGFFTTFDPISNIHKNVLILPSLPNRFSFNTLRNKHKDALNFAQYKLKRFSSSSLESMHNQIGILDSPSFELTEINELLTNEFKLYSPSYDLTGVNDLSVKKFNDYAVYFIVITKQDDITYETYSGSWQDPSIDREFERNIYSIIFPSQNILFKYLSSLEIKNEFAIALNSLINDARIELIGQLKFMRELKLYAKRYINFPLRIETHKNICSINEYLHYDGKLIETPSAFYELDGIKLNAEKPFNGIETHDFVDDFGATKPISGTTKNDNQKVLFRISIIAQA